MFSFLKQSLVAYRLPCVRRLTNSCWSPTASSTPPFTASKNTRQPPRSPPFKPTCNAITPSLRRALVRWRHAGDQHSAFCGLKEYPPAASIASIQAYLQRYHTVAETGIDALEIPILTPEFLDYLAKQAKRYSAKDLKRFTEYKRYTLMLCFLLETRKTLLDHLVTMHDQYLMEITRQTHRAHEQKHRELRKRQKRAIDVILDTTAFPLARTSH